MNPAPKEQDTRRRILDAGVELMAAKGFNGCGINEILQRAGVPKGSFYHYFASKEDFGVALIEQERDAHLAWARPIVGDRKRPPLERLRALFEWSQAECSEHGAARECLIPKLALETSQLSDPVHAAVKCTYQQWTSVIAQVIREAQIAGAISRDEDVERLARVLVMLWEGAKLRMDIERTAQPLDDFLHFVFDALLRRRE